MGHLIDMFDPEAVAIKQHREHFGHLADAFIADKSATAGPLAYFNQANLFKATQGFTYHAAAYPELLDHLTLGRQLISNNQSSIVDGLFYLFNHFFITFERGQTLKFQSATPI